MAARSALSRFWRDESGATAVETGVIVALICVAIISAVSALSAAIKVSFDKAGTAVVSTSGS
ncbi:Flp family type IVb pilin [Caulobacter sp. B11]|nr:Flp family type IVb pilin [Caulobacter sp. B11]PHY12524.1 Flp family type IVb pilin [Caulobacter sp. B11]